MTRRIKTSNLETRPGRKQQRHRVNFMEANKRTKNKARRWSTIFGILNGNNCRPKIQSCLCTAFALNRFYHEPWSRTTLVVAHQQLVFTSLFHTPCCERIASPGSQQINLGIGWRSWYCPFQDQSFQLKNWCRVKSLNILWMRYCAGDFSCVAIGVCAILVIGSQQTVLWEFAGLYWKHGLGSTLVGWRCLSLYKREASPLLTNFNRYWPHWFSDPIDFYLRVLLGDLVR